MISKKYSLREAFEKRLLESGEHVNLEGLYTPYKKIPQIGRYGGMSVLSLKSYFKEDALKNAEIRLKEGKTITVTVRRKSTDSDTASLIAAKLLADDVHNIKATCRPCFYDSETWEFIVVLNPDIIVRFEGKEEKPFLELPPHVAYTC